MFRGLCWTLGSNKGGPQSNGRRERTATLNETLRTVTSEASRPFEKEPDAELPPWCAFEAASSDSGRGSRRGLPQTRRGGRNPQDRLPPGTRRNTTGRKDRGLPIGARSREGVGYRIPD